ncbi:MAG: hypothetical protein EAZ92_05340 [Candidatus Kapaibacterium sp.]|nr:MAG: hypothetical protein EAZ92_05340 [Candidatus Kapabacteria bacterium]
MSYTTYSAHIRQHRIVLDAGAILPESAEAIIVILKKPEESEKQDSSGAFREEQQDWYALAAHNLQYAYDEHEPDYSDVPLQETNPLFRPSFLN